MFPHTHTYIYCHVSGVSWRIITGSGLDDWIYWHFCYNYNQLQHLTISECQDSRHSLLDYESFLPLWLTWFSDLRIGRFFSFRCPLVNTSQLNTQLVNSLTNDECRTTAQLSRMNRTNSFITVGRTVPQLFCFSVFNRCSGNVCLATRWLAMDFRFGSTIPAFRRYVNTSIYTQGEEWELMSHLGKRDSLSWHKRVYTQKLAHPTYIDPEDVASMYLRNGGNTARISTL
jgi:hypothetical protein